MKNSIDFYLLSGFLGSGKTTLLQRMLQTFSDKKIGVLINEFGSIGVDGSLIDPEGIQLVEINNGSIFCSCLKGNFIQTLIEFSKLDIDVLFIENSGMADPSNVHQILDELTGKMVRPLLYKGAVCMVDAVTFLKYSKVLTPVQNQVASSNFIIINKIDLVNEETLIEIRKRVKEFNPKAFMTQTMFAQIPMELFDTYLTDSGYVGETSNKDYNRPAVYSVEGDGIYQKSEIESFIRAISDFVLRIKGFVRQENGWLQVDGVGDYVEFTEKVPSRKDVFTKTKLVLIGKDQTAFDAQAKAAWQEYLKDVPFLYE